MAQKKMGRPPLGEKPMKDRIFVLVNDEIKMKLEVCKKLSISRLLMLSAGGLTRCTTTSRKNERSGAHSSKKHATSPIDKCPKANAA